MSLVIFKQANGREIGINPRYVTHVEPVIGSSFCGAAIHIVSDDTHTVVSVPGATVAEVVKILNVTHE